MPETISSNTAAVLALDEKCRQVLAGLTNAQIQHAVGYLSVYDPEAFLKAAESAKRFA